MHRWSIKYTGLATIFFVASAVQSASWHLESIDDLEYLPLAQITAAFGLGPPMAAGPKRLVARAGEQMLQVEVDSREGAINGVKHWFAYPVRGHANQVWVSRSDFESTIRPALRPDLTPPSSRVRTVILDAGHGGHDKGAHSPLGLEKDYALDMVQRVRMHLVMNGLRVVMTRIDDRFIELEARSRLANKHPNSIFVSIHFNAAGWRPSARGVEVYSLTPRGVPGTGNEPKSGDARGAPGHDAQPQSFILSNSIQHALLGRTDSDDRGVKRARFNVLALTRSASALVECGFLTNPGEAANVDSPVWRESVALAVADGILEYVRFSDGGEPPKQRAAY